MSPCFSEFFINLGERLFSTTLSTNILCFTLVDHVSRSHQVLSRTSLFDQCKSGLYFWYHVCSTWASTFCYMYCRWSWLTKSYLKELKKRESARSWARINTNKSTWVWDIYQHMNHHLCKISKPPIIPTNPHRCPNSLKPSRFPSRIQLCYSLVFWIRYALLHHQSILWGHSAKLSTILGKVLLVKCPRWRCCQMDTMLRRSCRIPSMIAVMSSAETDWPMVRRG